MPAPNWIKPKNWVLFKSSPKRNFWKWFHNESRSFFAKKNQKAFNSSTFFPEKSSKNLVAQKTRLIFRSLFWRQVRLLPCSFFMAYFLSEDTFLSVSSIPEIAFVRLGQFWATMILLTHSLKWFFNFSFSEETRKKRGRFNSGLFFLNICLHRRSFFSFILVEMPCVQ